MNQAVTRSPGNHRINQMLPLCLDRPFHWIASRSKCSRWFPQDLMVAMVTNVRLANWPHLHRNLQKQARANQPYSWRMLVFLCILKCSRQPVIQIVWFVSEPFGLKVRATFVQRPLWMLTEMAHHERAASFCVEKCRERSEGEAVGPPSALVFKGLEINVMLGWRPLLLGRGNIQVLK